MTKFKRATVPEAEREATVTAMIAQWRAGRPDIRKLVPCATETDAEQYIRQVAGDESRQEVWMNDTYQVSIRRQENLAHLSIKRRDRQPVHDWRDLQTIKSELIGPECEGVELYPAESRVVDTANQYHLWVVTRTDYRFPFGFSGERVLSEDSIGKSVNRPFQPA